MNPKPEQITSKPLDPDKQERMDRLYKKMILPIMVSDTEFQKAVVERLKAKLSKDKHD